MSLMKNPFCISENAQFGRLKRVFTHRSSFLMPWCQTLVCDSLPTATLFYHHVLILFVHDVVTGVYVKYTDGAEFCGDATARRSAVGVHGVHERLNDGVVGRLQVRPQWEVAHALAVVGFVIQRSDDPVVPSQLFEIDMQRLFAASRFGLFAMPFPMAIIESSSPSAPRFELQRALLLLLIVSARLDLLFHLIKQVFSFPRPRVDHQYGLFLLRSAVPVETKLL